MSTPNYSRVANVIVRIALRLVAKSERTAKPPEEGGRDEREERAHDRVLQSVDGGAGR